LRPPWAVALGLWAWRIYDERNPLWTELFPTEPDLTASALIFGLLPWQNMKRTPEQDLRDQMAVGAEEWLP